MFDNVVKSLIVVLYKKPGIRKRLIQAKRASGKFKYRTSVYIITIPTVKLWDLTASLVRILKS